MGYLRPTTIVVSASYDNPDLGHWAEAAHQKATEIFGSIVVDFCEPGELVSPIIYGLANDVRSFFVAWDGSKEGWAPSDAADEARAEFVAWLRGQAYSDGSSPLDWVELQYGGDDGEVVVLAHDGERVPA